MYLCFAFKLTPYGAFRVHRIASGDIASLLCMLRAVHLSSHSVRKSLASSDVARCNWMNSEGTIIVLDLFRRFHAVSSKIHLDITTNL